MSEEYRATTKYSHAPVMAAEVMAMLAPAPGEVCLDVTLGLGGHAAQIMPRLKGGAYIGIDRDPEALQRATHRLTALTHECKFSGHLSGYADAAYVLKQAGFGAVDLVLADLGVSSYQLDDPRRGFSFRFSDAPLDLRMGQQIGAPASQRIAQANKAELTQVLRDYGEIAQAGRLAGLLAAHPPQTTGDLARLASSLARTHELNKFLAKVFQAIRIWVNDELTQLAYLLKQIPQLVKNGARVVFLSYHSLEDRQVKRAFRDWEGPCVCPPAIPICRCNPQKLGERINKKALHPKSAEIAANPRARSAVLRGFRFWGNTHA